MTETSETTTSEPTARIGPDNALRTGVWIIATAAIICGLYFGADILAPFALAVFLWLVMESFTRRIDQAVMVFPFWMSRALGIIMVLIGFTLIIALMAQGVEQIGRRAGDYEAKINDLISDVYELLALPDEAPRMSDFFYGETGQSVLRSFAAQIQDSSQGFVLVLIYVAFLFLAQANWPTKLDQIFKDADDRERVRTVGADARKGIETYLWTQTVISVIITVLTYITLLIFGVQSAMFLCVMVFILNYIPTIGSIVAAFIPAIFALVQPDWPSYMPDNTYASAAIVFLGVSLWQFVIGNFLQPRMMGESLNLSSLVVLLSLAIWGAIWGIPGMFLSAPLTVLLMILLNQSKDTRWIAVLLSADGRPGIS